MSSALTSLLAKHVPADDKEQGDLTLMRQMAQSLSSPFSRTQLEAHFTGSAVVIDPAGARVCLLLHGKLHRWLQPGGHAEPGDAGDLAQTALREAREETGLRVALHPLAPCPLDVDAHRIPARQEEPPHLHLDVRFLLVAENPDALAPDPTESTKVQWFSFPEALDLADDPSLRRLLRKAQPWVNPPSAAG